MIFTWEAVPVRRRRRYDADDAAAQRDFIATLVPTGESSSQNTADDIHSSSS